MRVFCVLAAFLATPVVFGATVKQVKQVLVSAQVDFQEMAIDLPFDRVYGSWRQKIRDTYKTASRNVTEAISLVDRDGKRAVELLKTALSSFRTMGLLIPFYEIDKTKLDEVLARYLQAEDALADAIRAIPSVVVNPVPQPQPQPQPQPVPTPVIEYWRTGGLTWLPLSGTYSHSAALAECKKLQARNSKDWALPTFRELATYFREMKQPSANPVFGNQASQFARVWTADRHEPDGAFYYVHFQQEKSGTVAADAALTTVCVGTDTNP